MKSTGIVRKIDELGRIVLPKELRDKLGISNGYGLEIFIDKDCIILRRYEPGCTFCDESAHLANFKGKQICQNCLKDILRLPVKKGR